MVASANRDGVNDPRAVIEQIALACRKLWKIGPGRPRQGLMPANLIAFAHLSVSSEINLAKSAGESGSTVLQRLTDGFRGVDRMPRLIRHSLKRMK